MKFGAVTNYAQVYNYVSQSNNMAKVPNFHSLC
jgi:hypothetical protein